MFDIFDRFANPFRAGNSDAQISKDRIAELLQTTPEAVDAFEKAYKNHGFGNADGGIFDTDKDTIDRMRAPIADDPSANNPAHDRIVDDLVSQTLVYRYERGSNGAYLPSLPYNQASVQLADVAELPSEVRPQLLGDYAVRDLPDSDTIILTNYAKMLDSKTRSEAQLFYNYFRQGLDMLDIDPIMYEIIGMNPNSIGHWFPQLVNAVGNDSFFKIPSTTIVKVPMTILQMTRLDYMSLNPETKSIIDDWAWKVFCLNDANDYFIRTGTASSKFDFRNAHVTYGKEVHELGEYLVFIHSQGVELASPLTQPSIYGMHTTNEWCVREFIADAEGNPCIYKGLPLHTEYRLFIDCDTDEVLSCVPYWDPDTMKKRFGESSNSDSPHMIHDYVIFKSHESTLMSRYEANKDRVISAMGDVIKRLDLQGQWSVDVMQNGDDFWIIDMGLAQDSAFRDSIPDGKLRIRHVEWMPRISVTALPDC